MWRNSLYFSLLHVVMMLIDTTSRSQKFLDEALELCQGMRISRLFPAPKFNFSC